MLRVSGFGLLRYGEARPDFGWVDLLYAWLAATLLSGIPSTRHARWTGADVWEATRAAGAMLLEDERRFIDLPSSPLFFAEEKPIVDR